MSPQRFDQKLGTSAAALVLMLVLQMLTGLLLSSHYVPDAAGAHASVEEMRRSGGLITFLVNFHYWGSAVLIVHSFLHLAFLLWRGCYLPPHQWRWLGALILFVGAMLFQITGNLLPMDRHDARTAVIEGAIAGRLPLAGGTASQMLLGSEGFTEQTVPHWFQIHSLILPLAIGLGSIGAFLTHWSRRDMPVNWRFTAIPLALTILLAMMLAAPSGSPATVADYTNYSASPSWYTWPLHGALRLFGAIYPSLGWVGAILLPTVFVLFLVSLPLAGERLGEKWVRGIFGGSLGLFLFAAVTFGGRFAPVTGNQDPPAAPLPVTNPPVPLRPFDAVLAEKGRQVFNFSCSGCHGNDARGGSSAPSLINLRQSGRDEDWLTAFLRNPSALLPGSTMPAFPSLTQEELRALAEFLLREPNRSR